MSNLRMVAAVAVAAIALNACSGTSPGSGRVLPNSVEPQAKVAAVYGDTQAQLDSAIAAARAAGMIPIYVTVRASKRSYDFPVYGQFLRSHSGLIVRAYQRAYAFPLDRVRIRIAGQTKAVAPESLPFVTARYVDRVSTAWSSHTGVFTRGNRVEKTRICPDCVMLILTKNAARTYGKRWNALKDPWQIDPRYVAFAPTQIASAETMTPAANQCAQTGNCAPCGADSCAYSGGSMLSGGGGGGGGCSGINKMVVHADACGGGLGLGFHQVAITPGPPHGQCGATDGGKSLSVGDTVGYANVNGQAQARSVVDINEFLAFAGSNIQNASTVYIDLTTLGWIYEDNHGAFWFSKNPGIAWSTQISVGVTLGGLVTAAFGISPPSGQGAVSIGSRPGNIPSHAAASPCFTQGSQFLPGEIA